MIQTGQHHLVTIWNPKHEPDTIAVHKQIADEHGRVKWGIIKNVEKHRFEHELNETDIELLKGQINNNLLTVLFIIDRRPEKLTFYIGPIIDIIPSPEGRRDFSDDPLIPRYYTSTLKKESDLDVEYWIVLSGVERCRNTELYDDLNLKFDQAELRGYPVPFPIRRKSIDPIKIGDSLSSELSSLVDNVFRREGDYWSITFEGTTIRLRNTKGVRHIVNLIKHQGQELHVLYMVAAQEKPQIGSLETAPRKITERELTEAGLKVSGLGDAGEVLDQKAKDEYERRLRDLEKDLEEAQKFYDPGRATKIRMELDLIKEQLKGAIGLGGRARKAADIVERARSNIRNRIKDALNKIREENPSLGQHLTNAIKTGTSCSYIPDKPTRWSL